MSTHNLGRASGDLVQVQYGSRSLVEQVLVDKFGQGYGRPRGVIYICVTAVKVMAGGECIILLSKFLPFVLELRSGWRLMGG